MTPNCVLIALSALANPSEQEVPSPKTMVRHPQLRHQRSAETHSPRREPSGTIRGHGSFGYPFRDPSSSSFGHGRVPSERS